MGALMERESASLVVKFTSHPDDLENIEILLEEAIRKINEENQLDLQYEVLRL